MESLIIKKESSNGVPKGAIGVWLEKGKIPEGWEVYQMPKVKTKANKWNLIVAIKSKIYSFRVWLAEKLLGYSLDDL